MIRAIATIEHHGGRRDDFVGDCCKLVPQVLRRHPDSRHLREVPTRGEDLLSMIDLIVLSRG